MSAIRQLGTLVLAEAPIAGEEIPTQTLSTIRAAQALQQPITALAVGGAHAQQAARALSNTPSVERVLLAQHETLQPPLAEQTAALLAALQQRYHFHYLLAAGSSWGKDVLPRAAGLLHSQPISECVQIVDANTYVR